MVPIVNLRVYDNVLPTGAIMVDAVEMPMANPIVHVHKIIVAEDVK